MSALGDLFSGQFSKFVSDIDKSIAKLPAPEQALILKMESDAWGLVRSLASVAINDVVAGGFTTASFIAAGKDIVAKGAAQGQTIAMSDALIQLNILSGALQTPAATTATPAV